MGKKYIVVESGNSKPKSIKVDPANVSRQVRDLKAAGHRVSVLDENEMIKFGLIMQALRRNK